MQSSQSKTINSQTNKPHKHLGWLIIRFITLIILIALLIPISFNWIMFKVVDGNSMNDTLKTGELIMTKKINSPNDLNRGDIITAYMPGDKQKGENREQIIKRVIATPGQTIQITNDKVYVNHQLLNEPYVVHKMHNNSIKLKMTDGSYQNGFYPTIFNDQTGHYYVQPKAFHTVNYTLKNNEFWVLGDNRPRSKDSRFFGPLKYQDINGKATSWQPSWNHKPIITSLKQLNNVKTIIIAILVFIIFINIFI